MVGLHENTRGIGIRGQDPQRTTQLTASTGTDSLRWQTAAAHNQPIKHGSTGCILRLKPVPFALRAEAVLRQQYVQHESR